MNTLPVPIVALDTETTGKDPATAEVWELGMVRRELTGATRDWSRILCPSKPELSAEVCDVCGVTPDLQEAIRRASPFPERLAANVADLAAQAQRGDIVLMGYVSSTYDWTVLRRQCSEVGVDLPPVEAVPMLDVAVWVRAFYRHVRERKLSAMAQRLAPEAVRGIVAHRAVADCHATLALADAILAAHGETWSDLVDLLTWQGAEAARQAAEFEQFSYYAYERSGVLYCGFGKHCGRPLSEVGDFADWALGKMGGDMPLAAREAFERAAGGGHA